MLIFHIDTLLPKGNPSPTLTKLSGCWGQRDNKHVREDGITYHTVSLSGSITLLRDEECIGQNIYVQMAMQRLKINSIGLKLSLHLLLGLQEGRKEEEARKQWEDIEKNVGFYAQEDTPYKEAWDVKEATRAMKDMDIDDQVAQRMRKKFTRGLMMRLINKYIIWVTMPSSNLLNYFFSHLSTNFVILCLV